MAEIIETTVNGLEDLSDEAKEKARDWYRQGAFDDDWYWAVYSDFEQICDILGISLATVPVRLFGGGSRRKPSIWFSGFASQGERRAPSTQHEIGRERHVDLDPTHADADIPERPGVRLISERHRMIADIEAATWRGFREQKVIFGYCHRSGADILLYAGQMILLQAVFGLRLPVFPFLDVLHLAALGLDHANRFFFNRLPHVTVGFGAQELEGHEESQRGLFLRRSIELTPFEDSPVGGEYLILCAARDRLEADDPIIVESELVEATLRHDVLDRRAENLVRVLVVHLDLFLRLVGEELAKDELRHVVLILRCRDAAYPARRVRDQCVMRWFRKVTFAARLRESEIGVRKSSPP